MVFAGKRQPWSTEYSDTNIHIDYVPLLPEETEKLHNPPPGSDQMDTDSDSQDSEGTLVWM